MRDLLRKFTADLAKELKVKKYIPDQSFLEDVMNSSRYYRLLKNSESITVMELSKLTAFFSHTKASETLKKINHK